MLYKEHQRPKRSRLLAVDVADVGQEVAASGVGDVVGEVLDWALASDDGLCAEACKNGLVNTIYSFFLKILLSKHLKVDSVGHTGIP